jgi:protocatechuate 3,4-dioxygenase beta subunit
LELIRQDITDGKPGVPLRLRIAVADIYACMMLPDAAVDIWHCDAQGYYSGVDANPGGNASQSAEAGAGSEAGTFLRGIQLTNADGIAEFQTIYPGWYTGRTPHIHMKVHVGGTAVDASTDPEAMATPEGGQTYQEDHTSHTGQLFFDDANSDEVYGSVEAYAGRDDSQRTRNDQDNILGNHLDEPGFLVSLSLLDENDPSRGYLGVITIGVDPNATA